MTSKKPPTKPVDAPEPDTDYPDPSSTQSLVDRAKERVDSGAWTPLSQKVERFVRSRFGRSGLPPGHDPEDFLMEVMVKLLQDIGRYEETDAGSFWGWLYQVARNVQMDLHRRASAAKRGGTSVTFSDADREDLENLTDPDETSPTTYARRREIAEVEMQCVGLLSEKARTVYLLRRRDERSFDEIAEQLGGTADTLRSTFKRARDRVDAGIRSRMDSMGESWTGWRE